MRARARDTGNAFYIRSCLASQAFEWRPKCSARRATLKEKCLQAFTSCRMFQHTNASQPYSYFIIQTKKWSPAITCSQHCWRKDFRMYVRMLNFIRTECSQTVLSRSPCGGRLAYSFEPTGGIVEEVGATHTLPHHTRPAFRAPHTHCWVERGGGGGFKRFSPIEAATSGLRGQRAARCTRGSVLQT